MNMQSVVNTLDVYQSVVEESQGEYRIWQVSTQKYLLRNVTYGPNQVLINFYKDPFDKKHPRKNSNGTTTKPNQDTCQRHISEVE